MYIGHAFIDYNFLVLSVGLSFCQFVLRPSFECLPIYIYIYISVSNWSHLCAFLAHFIKICLCRFICICRLFNTQRCARCNMGIQSTDLVMRARNHVYHVTCFTCFTCNKALQAGDTFGLRDQLVYCQVHYENSYHAEYIALSPDMNAGQVPYYNGVGTLQKGRPRKRRSPNISSDEFAQNIGKIAFSFFLQIYLTFSVQRLITSNLNVFRYMNLSIHFASRHTVIIFFFSFNGM